MNCDEVQIQIDLQIGEKTSNIGNGIKSHIENCAICNAYHKDSELLRDVLSRQEFDVSPSELGDITFESIKAASGISTKSATVDEPLLSLKWAWIPIAVAAVFVMFSILPDSITENQVPFPGSNGIFSENEYWFNDLYDIEPEVIASLVDNVADIDILEEEFINEAEVDDLLGSLTDEEFEILYNRLSYKNGSTG